MNKDRLWTELSVKSKNDIRATCPKCQSGELEIINYSEFMTRSGKEYYELNYPHGIEHNFIGVLKCKESDCLHLINTAGMVDKYIEHTGHDDNGEYFEYHFDNYRPNYFHPNLRYFKIHKEIPKEIVNEIDLAFHHYFFDLKASANKIRTTIELILDDVKAAKFRYNSTKTKKIVFKGLHDRILHFKNKNKFISTLMLANKYIGNQGSHIGKVNNDDILNAFDNLEEILNNLYVKSKNKIFKKAEAIIQIKKGKR